MKLLLIDDQERLVVEFNLGSTKMHVKAKEPDYKNDFGLVKMPALSQPISYSLDFKADLEAKDSYALRLYPDRFKDTNVELQSCYTRGKTKCVHEQAEEHRKFCNDWVCVCDE